MGLTNEILVKSIQELLQGLYEAKLGGHIYKKRVSVGGRGKRGGARIIVAFKFQDKAFFIYGFPKNKLGNINEKEESALKELARVYFSYSEKQIINAVKAGELIEVSDEKIYRISE